MMYRRKKRCKWNGKRKNVRKIAGSVVNKDEMKKNHGYGAYFAKLQEEVKRNEARKNLIRVLDAIYDKKCEQYWEKAKPILQRMEQELIELGKIPSINQTTAVIKYCISLFDIASRAQDELDGILVCAPAGEGKQEAFDEFTTDLYYAGRHNPDDLRSDTTYGKVPYWNTTQKGEPINADTIKFGPEIGEKSRPASYWLTLSKKKKSYLCYRKGGKQMQVPMWKTDLIVKSGVYNVCEKLVGFLIDELSILLS